MTGLAGTWYDGQGSLPRPVRLVPVQPGMFAVHAADDGEDPATLAMAVADVALSPRLGRTPRILQLPGGGRVECADSPLFDDWFTTPSRVEAIADWLERRKLMAFAAALVVALGSLGFLRYGLPALASIVAPRIPPAVERSMSRQAMALMDRIELEPSRLPAARRAQIRSEFAALVTGLPRERDMRVLFRRSPRIGANAFALPDGELVLTDELVAIARTDDELLSVLAHEAGHHEHRHALRQTLESSGIVVIASILFGDVSGGSLTVSIPTVLLETGFSRGHEREADDFALDLLVRRGKSPAAFADILDRLEAAHGSRGAGATTAGVGYLSTHPPSEERIQRARDRAQAMR